MALVSRFEEGRLQRFTLHDEISATYYLHELDGRKLFQMNTMGRDTRDVPGKVSQSIQLDKAGAQELIAILSRHFGL
jgi:hypothetical protein